ncbi:hypothetical protein [Fodinicola acaciae]|uniref:hypothetical protein n=1 Tax=Fodinicola acaciae TaxID=2681555 RepID=UPI0013D1C66C|nr:hypothetical protein [Fodinicola acaciae]
MATETIRRGAAEITYGADGPLLLVLGRWPQHVLDALAERGFRVIRVEDVDDPAVVDDVWELAMSPPEPDVRSSVPAGWWRGYAEAG